MSRVPTPIYRGKVRDTYSLPGWPGHQLIVTTDRLSIFDKVFKEPIPGKGIILAKMTEFWLRNSPIATIAPNHFIPDGSIPLPEWARQWAQRSAIVRIANMQPVEWIVRGYLVGSAWREYQAKGTVHGIRMPKGLVECQQLPEPLLTPSTKAKQGDRDINISFIDATAIVGKKAAERAREMCLSAYNAAVSYARLRCVYVLDTKFELGELEDGELAFCDEMLTPDSSRFVLEENFALGKPPLSNDKEHVRQWARSIGWIGQGEPPHLPGYVARETIRRYRAIYERLIGPCPI